MPNFFMILRLLVTKKCLRGCKGCCNKDWNLDALPEFRPEIMQKADLIMLTGGEPMLVAEQLKTYIPQLKTKKNKIIMYTAENPTSIMYLLDGFTYTIHTKEDLKTFKDINDYLLLYNPEGTFYLNVFKEVEFKPEDYNLRRWTRVKTNIEWIKNCPLPSTEIFCKHLL